ncbi:hypothetical protein KI688_010424 [Linnemannia hyalina]|uniref:FAD-binding domain-containing protein n=1 Tax=Linnemannia hyalina TaxID=64524 RepID=A0A9P8BVU2_9FUNG|nr:hypothetical protein KI688_010424 [Linnemannia hyalina]
MPLDDKPKVLIVGAGLGGLMLGALLEKSNVPYQIFERAATVKPLGSALAVGPTLLPIFEQLGIYEELLAIGKYTTHIMGYQEQPLRPMRPLDFRPVEEFTGYGQYIVSRPKLYELVLKQVPPHKIHFGHRVLNITEVDDKVTVHLSNNNTFEGDIVVGADGAYSAVRQRMYEQLMAKGTLPKPDQEDLPFSCTCLVGQTKVLNPEEFPMAAMEQRFRNSENSEWGDFPAQTMCDETRDFPIPLEDGKDRTLGELYDQTPKELISMVMLEEKVFNTWYHRRFVLLGDGAVTAMHDAIALANLIYCMPTKTSEDITTIFEEYHKERLPAVMESYNNSRQLAKRSEKGIIGRIILYITTYMPVWLWRIAV